MDFSHQSLSVLFDRVLSTVLAHKKRIIMAGVAVLVGVAAFIGYGYYFEYCQAAAHKDLVEALRFYDAPVRPQPKQNKKVKAVTFMSDQEKWKKVAEVFEQSFNKHKNTGLAGVFMAYQADALAHLKEYAKAITVLTDALAKIPSQEMRDFYTLKLALLKIDADQKDGFAQLQQIALDQKHFANEVALYYIGEYFWSKKDFAQAKNYWQQMMLRYGIKDGKNQSGFGDVVREKLKLISADW